jgi:hypothetical protein
MPMLWALQCHPAHYWRDTMQITLTHVQAHCLAMLKAAQRNFNKNPNSTHFEVLTHAMLTHQQAQHITRVLRTKDDINLMLAQLSALPLGDWPDLIVERATGLTIRAVLTAA